jgi:hypothetical protein
LRSEKKGGTEVVASFFNSKGQIYGHKFEEYCIYILGTRIKHSKEAYQASMRLSAVLAFLDINLSREAMAVIGLARLALPYRDTAWN